jgi:hypothetical protein
LQVYLIDLKSAVPPNICSEDYLMVQLLEFTDAVDSELSEYEEPDPESIFPPKITRLILRQPVGGFPPFFCIDELFPYLYVSPQAKQALEDAGIRGLEFFSEEGIRAEGAAIS